MNAHNKTIFSIRVYLRAEGLGKDKKIFQNYFSVKSYGDASPNPT